MRSRSERRAAWALAPLGLWHCLALLVAPLPDSDLGRFLQAPFAPYARALHLDSRWQFFGPSPDPGTLVEYELEDDAGRRVVMRATEDLAARGRLSQRRYHLWRALAADQPALLAGAARQLCAEPGDLLPERVRFTFRRQLPLPPELYLAGIRPLDPAALEGETLDWIACPPDR